MGGGANPTPTLPAAALDSSQQPPLARGQRDKASFGVGWGKRDRDSLHPCNEEARTLESLPNTPIILGSPRQALCLNKAGPGLAMPCHAMPGGLVALGAGWRSTRSERGLGQGLEPAGPPSGRAIGRAGRQAGRQARKRAGPGVALCKKKKKKKTLRTPPKKNVCGAAGLTLSAPWPTYLPPLLSVGPPTPRAGIGMLRPDFQKAPKGWRGALGGPLS